MPGITAGTTATTYDPTSNVSRLQMAAFLSRSVDVALKRNSRKASLNRFSTPKTSDAIGLTTVGGNPYLCSCDGADVWVANHASRLPWKAADLSVVGSSGTGAGTTPNGACSDGVNFWITLYTVGKLARF